MDGEEEINELRCYAGTVFSKLNGILPKYSIDVLHNDWLLKINELNVSYDESKFQMVQDSLDAFDYLADQYLFDEPHE